MAEMPRMREHEERHRRAERNVAARDAELEGPGGEDVRHVARAARGQHADDVVVREGDDEGEQHRDRDDVAHHRQRDVDEALPGVGAVDRGGLIELLGHRFERRQIHDQEEGRAVPDVHQDGAEARPVRFAEPGDVAAEMAQEPVEGAVGRIEHPPPGEGRERKRHHPGNQQHAAPFALALPRQIVDEVCGDDADERLEEDRADGKDRRLLDHHPEGVAGEEEGEVAEADELGLGLVEHRKIDRVEERKDHEAEDEQEERRAPQNCDGGASAHEPLEAARPRGPRARAVGDPRRGYASMNCLGHVTALPLQTTGTRAPASRRTPRGRGQVRQADAACARRGTAFPVASNPARRPQVRR